MSTYPAAIDTFDSPVNQPGTEFPNGPATSIWAEHFTQRSVAIAAIQETLGVNPQGGYSSVVARLDDLPSGGGGSTNIDGGGPSSDYGGTTPIDGGTP